jgi:fumarylacetoacetase
MQATVISPWIVQAEALEPFRCEAPSQDPPPLPYLAATHRDSLDITMQASIHPGGSPNGFKVCRSHFRDLYWTFEQMLAHHTVGGCNIRTGDIIASGTVSSKGTKEGGPPAKGCLLEVTKNGQEPLKLAPEVERCWLEDGDTVQMRAWCGEGPTRVGFGPCDMTVLPARAAM